MKHFKAIQCITKRIAELQSECKKTELIMDEPEMYADYLFAENDLKNLQKEISELKETIKELASHPIIIQP